MRKAVGVLKELSADEVTRMLFEKQEMARMDIESRMAGERRKLEGIIADRDAEIASRVAEIASRDAEIALLRAQLEKQNGEDR